MDSVVENDSVALPEGDTPRKRLSRDVQGVASVTGVLLKDAAQATSEGLNNVRLQAREKLGVAAARLEEERIQAMQKSRDLADFAGRYVQENPWKAVGLSAALGLAVGLLIRRD